MEKMNVDDLWNKVGLREISSDELAAVVQRIKKYNETGNDKEIYHLIEILGYAGGAEYKDLIERYIYCHRDPSLSAVVLETLCRDWGLTSDYLDYLKSYVKGVEWDTGEDIRIPAIGMAGGYVRETGDRECLKLLLDVFENEQEGNCMRNCAYSSIARGLGKDLNEIPDFKYDVISEDLVDRELITRAHEFVNKKNGD